MWHPHCVTPEPQLSGFNLKVIYRCPMVGKNPKATGKDISSCPSTPRSDDASTTSRSTERELVGDYDMHCLSEAWDNDPNVRERLREGHHLMRHLDPLTGKVTNGYVEKTIENMKVNHFILAEHRQNVGPNYESLPQEPGGLPKT